VIPEWAGRVEVRGWIPDNTAVTSGGPQLALSFIHATKPSFTGNPVKGVQFCWTGQIWQTPTATAYVRAPISPVVWPGSPLRGRTLYLFTLSATRDVSYLVTVFRDLELPPPGVSPC